MTRRLTWSARPARLNLSRWTIVLALAANACSTFAGAQTTATLDIRGHPQSLWIYGVRGGPPAIVSSGDGGWIHLGPHVAEVLAARGYFVVGFDTKAYLRSFTSGPATLHQEDEPGDYKRLADFASSGSTQRPILIGVSEGAGLSVMAATDPATRTAISGVLGLGLPDVNELGWRWKDALIYVTHGVPNEPTFRTSTLVSRMARTPLAVIHASQDDFVPLNVVKQVLAAAHEPKRLWVVKASDHRFSGNLPEFDRRLIEALGWIAQCAAT